MNSSQEESIFSCDLIPQSSFMNMDEGPVDSTNMKSSSIEESMKRTEEDKKETEDLDVIQLQSHTFKMAKARGKVMDAYADKTCEAGIKKLLPYGN